MINSIISSSKDNSIPNEEVLNFHLYDPENKLVDIIVYNEAKTKINISWSKFNNHIAITLKSKSISNLSLEVKSVQKNLSPINFGQIRLEFKHIGTVGHIVPFHFFIKKWKVYVIYVPMCFTKMC